MGCPVEAQLVVKVMWPLLAVGVVVSMTEWTPLK